MGGHMTDSAPTWLKCISNRHINSHNNELFDTPYKLKMNISLSQNATCIFVTGWQYASNIQPQSP